MPCPLWCLHGVSLAVPLMVPLKSKSLVPAMGPVNIHEESLRDIYGRGYGARFHIYGAPHGASYGAHPRGHLWAVFKALIEPHAGMLFEIMLSLGGKFTQGQACCLGRLLL